MFTEAKSPRPMCAGLRSLDLEVDEELLRVLRTDGQDLGKLHQILVLLNLCFEGPIINTRPQSLGKLVRPDVIQNSEYVELLEKQ